jgi:hypothetical protein
VELVYNPVYNGAEMASRAISRAERRKAIKKQRRAERQMVARKKKGCGNKAAYGTRLAAECSTPFKFRTYLCPDCGKYHLTSK